MKGGRQKCLRNKLFEILMDSSLKKSFLTKYAEYLKNIEEDKDETTIFE